MKSLADALGGNAPARPCGRQYRHTATFVMDARKHFTALTTQQRARLLDEIERMERRTKPANHGNGIVTRPGLAVMRALLLHFADRKTGACFPSYRAIQDRTGYCRQTIAAAVKRLERIGVLKIVRRLVRRTIDGVVRCVQGTNLYSFATLPARVDLSSLADPAPKRAPGLLGRLNLTSRVMGRGVELRNPGPLGLLISGVRG
jgi:hypothetical protein